MKTKNMLSVSYLATQYLDAYLPLIAAVFNVYTTQWAHKILG